jgi:hypothetical protein
LPRQRTAVIRLRRRIVDGMRRRQAKLTWVHLMDTCTNWEVATLMKSTCIGNSAKNCKFGYRTTMLLRKFHAYRLGPRQGTRDCWFSQCRYFCWVRVRLRADTKLWTQSGEHGRRQARQSFE